MHTSYAILIGAALATLGWLYTSHRGRTLAKKQQTITVMMMANFNEKFLGSRAAITEYVKGNKKLPENIMDADHADLKAELRHVMNHYEFVAAALRNGDLDEKLVKDSERSTLLMVYGNLEEYIWSLRTGRDRESIYEHLQWIHNRWEKKPPSFIIKFFEFLRGKPFYGSTKNNRP